MNITNGVHGVIQTNMADSHGIFGQSIGGGGGSGGGGGVGLATVGGQRLDRRQRRLGYHYQ
ncbi:MAG: hypothetical protein WDN28_14250 [Chthoniobacter sp.]